MNSSTDPWTLYWQADRLESCIATAQPTDQLEIRQHWQAIARSFNRSQRVVDLATGNGSVPAALLSAQPDLKITAIDLAEIEPANYVKNQPLLSSVEFHGKVDLCNLPFEDGAFDAATSQFGIEYATRPASLVELSRIIKPSGRVFALLHHTDSAVLAPVVAQLAEFDQLLATDGIVASALQYVAGELSGAELETRGQAYIAAHPEATRPVSGQIFTAVGHILTAMGRDSEFGRELGDQLAQRTAAERARLRQLQAAALTVSAADKVSASLESLGWSDCRIEPMRIGGDNPALIGWWLEATRAN